MLDTQPRDEAARGLLARAFSTARLDEWAEFRSDAGKFEAEIAKEISKQKFTFAELEEEEQSLERLRRWYLELKKRDVLQLPEAEEAKHHLESCTQALEEYAQLVYSAMHLADPETGSAS